MGCLDFPYGVVKPTLSAERLRACWPRCHWLNQLTQQCCLRIHGSCRRPQLYAGSIREMGLMKTESTTFSACLPAWRVVNTGLLRQWNRALQRWFLFPQRFPVTDYRDDGLLRNCIN